MKKRHFSILLFGFLLALLTATLHFFEYRYYIGSLSNDIYTSIVAIIFTAVGIWVGINLFKSKPTGKEHPIKINYEKAKEFQLKEREYEVLQLIAQGHTNQEIADKLFLALPTIKTHTSSLFTKLDVRNRTQAIHKAQTLQLI